MQLMDTPPHDCMSAPRICDKTFHFCNSASVHSNSRTYIFCAKESEKFPGVIPRTPVKGKGRKGRTEGGKEGIRDINGEEGSGMG
jgi:hypothetical protein